MKKAPEKETVPYSFRICSLAEEICKTALEGPTPHFKMSDVVREAVYQWGIVNIVREPEGGLRIARQGSISYPFGFMREHELYRKSLARNRQPHTTSVVLPMFLDAFLRTAVEDFRGAGSYKSRADVINVALIQWGFTHLELSYKEGSWDLAKPMALRQAFDLSPYDVPIRTVSYNPDAITAPEKVFPAADRYSTETKGFVSVPFYRPDADKDYLEAVAAGTHVYAPWQEKQVSRAEQEEAEMLAQIERILDAIEFD